MTLAGLITRLSDTGLHLLAGCLAPLGSRRITARQALKATFFSPSEKLELKPDKLKTILPKVLIQDSLTNDETKAMTSPLNKVGNDQLTMQKVGDARYLALPDNNHAQLARRKRLCLESISQTELERRDKRVPALLSTSLCRYCPSGRNEISRLNKGRSASMEERFPDTSIYSINQTSECLACIELDSKLPQKRNFEEGSTIKSFRQSSFTSSLPMLNTSVERSGTAALRHESEFNVSNVNVTPRTYSNIRKTISMQEIPAGPSCKKVKIEAEISKGHLDKQPTICSLLSWFLGTQNQRREGEIRRICKRKFRLDRIGRGYRSMAKLLVSPLRTSSEAKVRRCSKIRNAREISG
ncbi:unnamed protein product [Protopolystoma xenopodis]|uniref:Uncharacterized protein n=1 Tax=Protopolystoma xenopodis TaxID=117903 RepID=A0A448X0F1_9PLAT|nr:unnamed protein product [Protopolystoma xenopodis]